MKIGNEMKTYKKIIAGVTGIFIGVVQGISVNVMAAEANVQPDAPVVQVSNLQYSYEQMKQDLEILQEKYPEQIQIESLGTTVDGREILEAVLGNVNAEHHILIQATMHAREYMNTVLAMNQIEDYLRYSEERSYNGKSWSELYKKVCFHVIPMVNPDGVTISQKGVDGISDAVLKSQLEDCYQQDLVSGNAYSDSRQYFALWKANARGVDLNRNFDAGWEEYTGAANPASECYKGTSPASEAEVQAILSVSQNYDLDCCIAYHSFGNLIYWNYGSQGEVMEADQRLASLVSGVTGYEMHSTIQDATDAAGCSDYFVLKLGIPAVTIENGGSQCPMPVEEYQPMYQRNQNLWPALAEMYGK